MEISGEKLKEILNQAFEAGYYGAYELKSQAVDEIMKNNSLFNTANFRVWKVKEISEMPEGTIFHHFQRGRCWIMQRSNGTKFVQFQKGGPVDLASDTDPWDVPMRLIASP